MSTVMYIHTEVKIDNVWHHYSRYIAFGEKVRENGWGIPDNVSMITQEDLDYYAGDGHHHSWLTFGEVKGCFCVPPVHLQFQDVRFVFWYVG